jgi:hypothetical protein
MFTDFFLSLFFSLTISAPADSGFSYEEIDKIYGKSYQVFTGFLTSRYMSSSTLQPGSYMVEFEVTEIQKGPRRQKVLTYLNESDTLELNHEYLVFMSKGKRGNAALPVAIYKVCHKCENAEIKRVYELVRKKPFRKIKQPLPKYSFSSGCGC